MEELLYTVPQVAKLLHVNQNCVHDYRKAGLLRFLKLGCYKVRREELLRFLAENEGKDLTNPYDVKALDDTEEVTKDE